MGCSDMYAIIYVSNLATWCHQVSEKLSCCIVPISILVSVSVSVHHYCL